MKKDILMGFAGIILIAILFLSGCTTTEPVKDCNYYCSLEGYQGATDSSCISFSECNDPYMPLTADVCEGIELCCCKG